MSHIFSNNDLFLTLPNEKARQEFFFSLSFVLLLQWMAIILWSYLSSFPLPACQKTLAHVLFNSSHEQMRSLKQIKNRWSSRKWRYAWVPGPICWAACPQDRPQKAIDIYWWHLHTWIHLGASQCMNNAPCVLVCECVHVCACTSVHLFI